MANTSLYVRGYPMCGRNERFYNELKEKFLNKSVPRLKFANSLQADENIKDRRNIFCYLDAIRASQELIFVRFEAQESKTHRSKLNLTANWQSIDAASLYDNIHKGFIQQAEQRSYIKLVVPVEHEPLIDNMYLFALKKKPEQNGPDAYFDKYHVRLVRSVDLIMGVIIRKARTPNGIKRTAIAETSAEQQEMSKRIKVLPPSPLVTPPILDTPGAVVPPLQRSTSVQPISMPRDPRLMQRQPHAQTPVVGRNAILYIDFLEKFSLKN